MPTRNVVLTDRQAQFIEKLASSGRYQNASEVLREAARAGMADINAGRFRSFKSTGELSRRLTAIADQAIGGKQAKRKRTATPSCSASGARLSARSSKSCVSCTTPWIFCVICPRTKGDRRTIALPR